MEEEEVTWTEITLEPQEKIDNIEWPHSDFIWINTTDGERWLSRDQGATWTKMNSIKFHLLKSYLRFKAFVNNFRRR
jgi:hypothetical protein